MGILFNFGQSKACGFLLLPVFTLSRANLVLTPAAYLTQTHDINLLISRLERQQISIAKKKKKVELFL